MKFKYYFMYNRTYRGPSPQESMERARQAEIDWWKKLDEMIKDKEPDEKGHAYEAKTNGRQVDTKIWRMPYTGDDGISGTLIITKYFSGNMYLNRQCLFAANR
ncbi:MAG: hypothetical protein WDN09_00960 [bacterium]